MRKCICLLFIAVGLILLSACQLTQKREVVDFLTDLKSTDLLNTIQIDNHTYQVLLSNDSPRVYNIKSNEHYYSITVSDDRSFVYLMDQDTGHRDYTTDYFYFDRTSLTLYQLGEINTEIEMLKSDDLTTVIASIQEYLDDESNLVSFSDLYPNIHEVFSNIKPRQLELHGDQQLIVKINLKTDDLLKTLPNFKDHLEALYGKETSQEVIDSIETNIYKKVTISILYDSKEKKLLPYFKIYRNQLHFYTIEPMDVEYRQINME